MTFCINSIQYQLTGGTPVFGTYSGPGVTGAWFYPTVAGPGVHTIAYTYLNPSTGCSNTFTRQFTVTSAAVSWPGNPVTLCQNVGSVALTGGTPFGGTYSGTGVSGGFFNPGISGTGTFVLTYTWFDATLGCNGVATRTYTVVAEPTVSWPGGQVSLCMDDPPVSLSGASPAGGLFSGPGVVFNTFDPSVAGPGYHNLAYTFTDPSSNCSALANRVYFVDLCIGINNPGLEEIQLVKQSGGINVIIPDNLNQNLNIRVINLLGQELYMYQVAAGTLSHFISLPRRAESVLFVKVSNGKDVQVTKVVTGN